MPSSNLSPLASAEISNQRRHIRLWSLLLWLVGLGAAFAVEFAGWTQDESGLLARLLTLRLETLLLLAAPLVWCVWSARRAASGLFGRFWSFFECKDHTESSSQPLALRLRALSLCVIVGAVSLFTSIRVGAPFEGLPPAYHDEYSYLFQARTFLAGRLWSPSHAVAPELFDQMHILNEGRFASRYFPGTGLWLAPWVSVGHPVWGQWFAGVLIAMLVFGTGRELGGDGVGLLAGVLTGLAPGMALFSNLLLAHHATLVGLGLFWFSYIRWRNQCQWPFALLAGVGLAWAMLCRPMTAAGVAFPFGTAFAVWLVRGDASVRLKRLGHGVAMGAPLLAGFVILFVYNQAITGSSWVSTYQLYTDIYTPRHVYGFDNVERGAKAIGDRILPLVSRNYDSWPTNLTPARALDNVWLRLIASWTWTLGIVPCVIAFAMWLMSGPRLWRDTWLLPASILSLHLAHVPYWYDGILHYHYVFESGPIWLLMLAIVTGHWLRSWREAGRPGMKYLWGTMIAVAVFVNYVPSDEFTKTPLQVETSNLLFAKGRYARFRQLVEERVTARPALVLVVPDRSDQHLDYVVNEPALDHPVLFGRLDEETTTAEKIAELFPDRYIYVYRAKENSLLYHPR